MSDIPPSQSMFNPDSPLNPKLRYDGAGNAYAYHMSYQIPLPNSPDRELHDPMAIAEAQGYAPAISTAGARRKTAAKANKGKGKENTSGKPVSLYRGPSSI
ncbi:uncharacterized protein EDB91DRAFT_1082498 [Suillus paluster]|uniref:uncharacterized protein n=1 Tax=Suillus paluster TaxID=48578 RepID=UPI001B883BDA|nr:uncharacterized protein EDB91DRAFT_1082498 [Suillus paluster]KAG1739168.1 hypothetical protein EDB91DRAFT_1082498 [Suillus paluster]